MNEFNYRSRQWFICVQEGAKCYRLFEEIMDLLPTESTTWAYIKHDKEHNSITGEEKNKHYHAVIVFDNARSFSAMQKKFAGAHIEKAIDIGNCSAYLLHNTDQCKLEGKKTYEMKDIVTNSADMVRQWLGNRALKRPRFNPERIIEYIVFDGLQGVGQFYMTFGSQIQRYIPLITSICNEYYSDSRNQAWIQQVLMSKRNVYNRYSGSCKNIHVSREDIVYICSRFFYVFDLIVDYQRWEYVNDDDFFCYLYSDRPDIVELYKLNDVKVFEFSYLIEYMKAFAENSLF